MRSTFISVLLQFFGVTSARPPCFLAPFVALNFRSRSSILPARYLYPDSPFYRRTPSPLQLPYRSSVVSLVPLSVTPASLIYPTHLFLFPAILYHPPFSPVLRSLAILSIPCLQFIWMHGVPPGDEKGIHGQATRRTTEIQIYFLNTVDITVSTRIDGLLKWSISTRFGDIFEYLVHMSKNKLIFIKDIYFYVKLFPQGTMIIFR